ncbi:hypothetical protein DAPPUDRAFT_103311 [Daphnia pulex]|uniref:Reelin domain-containing protein n=1 Tax=Daphnia pulex TaxID=6669 RepID=E9GIZ6_DAPPU|nr:hypothetical protein DAPPUDRAFT_103311 [Daphnia pulex]|eukprot:EFX80569.1 hypothetical protein DAPPUDRAFT_103311 [Daphnia pulex]
MRIRGVITKRRYATCSSSTVIAALIVFRVIIHCADNVNGFSDGVPISSCSPMESIHGVPPQIGNHPFFTYTDKKAITNSGADAVQLRLTIKQRSLGNEMAFKGFFLVAYDDANANNDSIGSFLLPSDGQVISCSNGIPNSNAVTHKSSDDKQFVTVYWTPPEYFVGSVTFRTTYLRNGTVFWVNTPAANPVRVVNVTTTTISPGSTTTELVTLPTTLSSTDASCSDATSDSSDTITSTTETMFNTTEEEENSTSILTTPTAEATTTATPTTNKPPNSGLASEFVFDFHLLVAGLTCWTVFVYLSNNYLLF